jgi:hypothetical protein
VHSGVPVPYLTACFARESALVFRIRTLMVACLRPSVQLRRLGWTKRVRVGVFWVGAY